MTVFDTMTWLNPPPSAEIRDGALHVRSGEKTDFWQGTYYGFHRDDGHFLHQRRKGDFTAEVTFSARYEALYDQAGLMLRSSERRWIKAGVEFTHGRATLGTVLTQGLSDWSIGPEVSPQERIHLRLIRKAEAVCVQWAKDGKFQTLRLGAFAADGRQVMQASATR